MDLVNISETFKNLETQETLNKAFFYKSKDCQISYKQLLTDVNKIHVILKNYNLEKGDKVILSTNNDYYTALIFISLLRYGIVTVFLDPNVKSIRAQSIINKVAPKACFMDKDLFESRKIDSNICQIKIKAEEQKKGKLFKRLLRNKTQEISYEKNCFPDMLNTTQETSVNLEPIFGNDIAYIIFTSGTTSAPKGVMISHESLFTHLHTLSKVYSLNKNSRILNILMLYHADGCIQGPILSLYNAATWLRPFTFDLAKIGDLFNSVYKFRTTHLITVPTVLSFMNKFKENYEDSFLTDDFELLVSVASKLEKDLWSDFENNFQTKILNVYGLTETVAGSLFSTNGSTSKKGTIGTPIDCEAKLIKNNGETASVNEEGVLMLKGKHIFTGYLNAYEETEKVLQNGWLNTGDIAIKDNEGNYTIIGREKSTINSGGVNIYPEQVSEMINTHPDVVESICVGIHDESFGEKLVTAIVAAPNKPINELDLVEFLRPLLEQNQIPKEYYFFEELPKGISGKIITNEVIKLIIDNKKDLNDINQIKNYQHSIIQCASEAFGESPENISFKDSSYSLDGWDSMGHLIFVTSLEKKFNIRFSTAEMMTMNTLSSVEKILKSKLVLN
ncbi:AMP-binding protein [Tenacibaculum xiamenense]|uniref:AMP-binding protein n=1 Tax=Tenacibaculum xiamenense TaxID=1261553 RepID=UPI003894A23E